jgi:hypothetical protein
LPWTYYDAEGSRHGVACFHTTHSHDSVRPKKTSGLRQVRPGDMPVEILRLDVKSEHVGDQDVQGTRNLIDGVRREVRPGVRGTPQVARGRPLPARSGPGGIHGLRWLNFLTIRRPNGAGAGLKMTAAQRFRKSQLTARLAARISPMSVGLRESLFRVEQACLRHLGLHFGSPRVPVGIDDCPAFSLIRQCHGIRHFNCSNCRCNSLNAHG